MFSWTWGQDSLRQEGKEKQVGILVYYYIVTLWQCLMASSMATSQTLSFCWDKDADAENKTGSGINSRNSQDLKKRDGGRAECCRRCSRALSKVTLPLSVLCPSFVLQHVSSRCGVIYPGVSPRLSGCSIRHMEEVLWRKKPQINRQFGKAGFVPLSGSQCRNIPNQYCAETTCLGWVETSSV